MVMMPAGLTADNDCAGEAQQQLETTGPSVSSERAYHVKDGNYLTLIKVWSWVLDT
jgi:hypothetical protein